MSICSVYGVRTHLKPDMSQFSFPLSHAILVPEVGLEPTHLSIRGFESRASTNSAIPAIFVPPEGLEPSLLAELVSKTSVYAFHHRGIKYSRWDLNPQLIVSKTISSALLGHRSFLDPSIRLELTSVTYQATILNQIEL